MITALDDRATRTRALHAGAAEFLTKPWIGPSCVCGSGMSC